MQRIAVEEVDREPVNADELRGVILEYFAEQLPEVAQTLKDRPLQDIVAEAASRYTVRVRPR
jgi:hypothetical protein